MGNFAYHSTTTSCCDGEAYMADTFDAHGYAAQTVWDNNIGFDAARYCIQIYDQQLNAGNPKLKFYNNTCYGDLNSIGSDFADGEINFNAHGSSSAWLVSITNNLAQTSAAASNGHPIYGVVIGGTHWTALTDSGNVLNGSATTCASGTCRATSSPYSTTYFNSNTPSAGDTYTTPGYTNVSDLMTNRTGTPNCSGFANTTQCMGWNANTSTLTTPSIISDLVPTASGTSGKGYQKPSTTCAANGDYPTWLKGVVYLHWNGTALTENAGLVNKPCGL